VDPETFTESLNNISYHYDEPFGDSSAIPTGYVSKFAASNVKMVLTGDGGDEVLSGYTIYQGEKFAAQYQKLPSWIRAAVPLFLSGISKPLKGSVRYKINRMQEVCNSSNSDFLNRYISKSAWIDLPTIKKIIDSEKVFPVKDFIKDLMNNCSYKDPFYKLMYLNFKLSLPEDMLVKVDRMSMANSLETRAPFLDYRLIEYMVNVHKDVKMKKYERKTVLKNTIATDLPPALLSASKKGFSVPLREWFKENSLEDQLKELKNHTPILNKETIASIINMNNSGKKDYGNFLWMLFNLKKHLA
jgi:asparagine synthase (glutamine-hydrolysing)